MSYKFFQNLECEFFPCAPTDKPEEFSCIFCFCPLYQYDDCGGLFTVLHNGIKDCSDCLIPHHDYDYVIAKIKEKNQEITDRYNREHT